MKCSFDFLHHTIREKDTYIDFHSHSNYELVYYVSGSGTTEFGDKTYRYAAGTFTLIEPNCMHNEIRLDDTEVIFVCFDYEHASARLTNGLYADRDGTVLRLLRSMTDEIGGQMSLSDLAIHGLLYQLVAAAFRCKDEPDRLGTLQKVTYAKRYLEQYCTEKIDLQGLARNLGYSYDHFRHFFKQTTGYSPSRYMIRNRIERAKKMLADTDKTVTAIGLECGFSNTAQFTMMFKKDTGYAPKTYRDHHRRPPHE